MILHFVVMLFLLTRNLVATSTKTAEVSAILPSRARSVLRGPYIARSSQDLTIIIPIAQLSPTVTPTIFRLIPHSARSQASFNTHRS